MCFVSSIVIYYRFGGAEWIKDEIAHKLIMMYCKVITTANSNLLNYKNMFTFILPFFVVKTSNSELYSDCFNMTSKWLIFLCNTHN